MSGDLDIKPTVFHSFLENSFNFPIEIKNDLIYCQRSLRTYLKLHQMVLEVFETQEDADPEHKDRILEELEQEVYEINAEQQYLLLRLRAIILQFFQSANAAEIKVDENATNLLISKEVVPFVSDENFKVYPVGVALRSSEESLIEKYFEIKKNLLPGLYKSLESKFEEVVVVPDVPRQGRGRPRTKKPAVMLNTKKPSETGTAKLNLNSANLQGTAQVSLLKPISQRLAENAALNGTTKTAAKTNSENVGGGEEVYAESEIVVVPIIGQRNDETAGTSTCTVTSSTTSGTSVHAVDTVSATSNSTTNGDSSDEATSFKLPASQTIVMSRLNLRQALKKAHNENLAAKAAAHILSRAPTSLPTNRAMLTGVPDEESELVPASLVSAELKVGDGTNGYAIQIRKEKGNDGRAKSSRVVASTHSSAKISGFTSSSEDSNPERDLTIAHAMWRDEYQESRTKAEQYGQEMFLRLFELFTPEMHAQMQQRRSKRKRRSVHSNERADFHYGRVEYNNAHPSHDDGKKKRKAFLLSPQVKNKLNSKRPKRSSADAKNEEADRIQSNPNSPNEKRECNECLKSGGPLECCDECNAFFHMNCLRGVKKPYPTYNKLKSCPSCRRSQQKPLRKGADPLAS